MTPYEYRFIMTPYFNISIASNTDEIPIIPIIDNTSPYTKNPIMVTTSGSIGAIIDTLLASIYLALSYLVWI